MSTRTVVATWLRPDGTTPQVGRVLFTPNARLIRRDDTPAILLPRPVEVDLDEDGAISVALPCTGTSDVEPDGWVWTITERFHGADETVWSFELPAVAPPAALDLTTVDVAPAPPPVIRGAKGDQGDQGDPPGPHGASHAAAGADPVTLTQAQVTGLVAALAAKLDLADPRLADTGWRAFPEQSFTVTIGAQSGIAFRVTLLQRRVGSLVMVGMVWARDTALTVTTGAASMFLTIPDGWMVASDTTGRGLVTAAASMTEAAVSAVSALYSHLDITGVSRLIFSASAVSAAQAGVTVGSDYEAKGPPGGWTDEPWPDPLPGVAYP